MSHMSPCIVWHNFPDDPTIQGFRCMAEDFEHAIEQCANAYPDADIIEVELLPETC